MYTLAELQHRFVGAALSDHHQIERLPATRGRVSAAAALAVHRNTVLAALAKTLELTFPTVHRLVGEDFFDQIALAYSSEHPPRRGALNGFASNFPEFVAGYRLASGLAYLADVARLDLAIDRALAGPGDRERRLFDIDPAVALSLPISLVVLELAYPADLIRQYLEAENETALARLDLQPRPRWLAVWRGQRHTNVQLVGAPAGIFLKRLLQESPADDALAAAFAAGSRATVLTSIQSEVFAAAFSRLSISPSEEFHP